MRFEEQVRKVAAAIADYLAAHPQAKDTRPGIRAWWLPKEHRSVTDEVLDAALEQLEREQVVKFDSIRGTASAHGALVSSTGSFSAPDKS